MGASFIAADGSAIEWTDAAGTVWTLASQVDGDDVTIIGDTAIARDVRDWLAAGNTPTAYHAPAAIVPDIVPKLHLMRALRAADLWSDVQTAITNAGGTTLEDWNAASEIRRNDPLVTSLAAGLSIDRATLDALWIAAGQQ